MQTGTSVLDLYQVGNTGILGALNFYERYKIYSV